MAQKIYLVVEAEKEAYKKAAVKNHAKNNVMDCWIATMNICAERTKENAIKYCRKYNKTNEWATYFVQEVKLY